MIYAAHVSDLAYDPAQFPARAVTVDVAVFTIIGSILMVLMLERGADAEVFPDRLALPGTFVRDENLDDAARRVVAEKASTELGDHPIVQFGAYGDPGRDPRMRVVSIGYVALVADAPPPVAGAGVGVRRAAYFDVDALLAGSADALAFDHHRILGDARARVAKLVEETPAALDFCGEEFTISELRQVYEVLWGESLDAGNFHRRVGRIEGFIEPVEAVEPKQSPAITGEPHDEVLLMSSPLSPPMSKPRGRPARRFRRGSATALHPALRRPGDHLSRSRPDW